MQKSTKPRTEFALLNDIWARLPFMHLQAVIAYRYLTIYTDLILILSNPYLES